MDIDLRTFDRERLDVFFRLLVEGLIRGSSVAGVAYEGIFYPEQRDLAQEINRTGLAGIPPELHYQLEEVRGNNPHWVVRPLVNPVDPEAIQYRIEPGLYTDPDLLTEETDPDVTGMNYAQRLPLMQATVRFLNTLTDLAHTRILLSRPLFLHCTSGYSTDARGTDLLPFRLPQEEDLLLPETFTIPEFIDALIRLKSQHFEWWYEGVDATTLLEYRTHYVLNIEFTFEV